MAISRKRERESITNKNTEWNYMSYHCSYNSKQKKTRKENNNKIRITNNINNNYFY